MRHTKPVDASPLRASADGPYDAGRKRTWRRAGAVGATLVALLANGGCATLTIWSDDGFWPPARNHVTAIDAASFAADAQLHVRFSYRSPWCTRLRVPCTPSGEWLRLEPTDDAMPSTTLPVHVVGPGGLRALVDANPDGAHHALAAALWLELEADAGGVDYLWILDSRTALRTQRVDVPPCGLAWTSPNLVGHLAATPATVAADAVTTLPLLLVIGVLMACGVRLGH